MPFYGRLMIKIRGWIEENAMKTVPINEEANMKTTKSIHDDETQPYTLTNRQDDNQRDRHVNPDDETIPILKFQNNLQDTPSWWESAQIKAQNNQRWWKWTWFISFGVLSFLAMWAYSFHFLNQKNRDVHLIIANPDSFFNDAGGWAKMSDIDGVITQQGILFESMAIGDHVMTIGFDDTDCRSIVQRFRLNIGDETLTVPLKEWRCLKED